MTNDDLFNPVKRLNFNGSSPGNLKWISDSNYYIQSKFDRKTNTGVLLKVDARTGDSSPLFDAEKMEKALAGAKGIGASDAKKLSHQFAYELNGSQTGVLLNFGNDLYYYQLEADSAVRLTNGPDEEKGEDFSPDGRLVAFIRKGNLYVVDIATQKERQLTSDGSSSVLNGELDWVYEEELYGRGNHKGFWWSPDSTKIAFLKLDEAPVKAFPIVDHIPHHQEVEEENYPLAGDPNPIARIGIASINGQLSWADISKYTPDNLLVSRVDWAPDSQNVIWQAQDRQQTFLDLNKSPVGEGKTSKLFTEKTKAWVDVVDNPVWLKDGTFLWRSERTGFMHIYHYAPDGKLLRQITNGQWEARSISGVDESGGYVYFTSNEHSPLADQFYRIRLDGTGLKRVTEREGSHRVSLNPKSSMFIDWWSDVSTPTQVRLYNVDGTLIRPIDENNVPLLAEFKLGKPEFLQVKTRDGFVMEAMMIRPPDFDPSKKYPVLSYTYSGPHAQSVRNGWGREQYLWHQLMAEKGYIIWICDNRSASGKGAESELSHFRPLSEAPSSNG